MAVQKQSAPSFALITSVLSIVFYCTGFIRLEMELHEQKSRINVLESVAMKAKSPSDTPNTELLKNAPGKPEQLPMFFKTIMTCLEGKMLHVNES